MVFVLTFTEYCCFDKFKLYRTVLNYCNTFPKFVRDDSSKLILYKVDFFLGLGVLMNKKP